MAAAWAGTSWPPKGSLPAGWIFPSEGASQALGTAEGVEREVSPKIFASAAKGATCDIARAIPACGLAGMSWITISMISASGILSAAESPGRYCSSKSPCSKPLIVAEVDLSSIVRTVAPRTMTPGAAIATIASNAPPARIQQSPRNSSIQRHCHTESHLRSERHGATGFESAAGGGPDGLSSSDFSSASC